MDNLPVNITDLVVVITVLVSAFLAYARGFVHEILSVAGWIGGGLTTLYSFPYFKSYSRELISIELVADILTCVVIFVLSLSILSLLTKVISKSVQKSALSPIDRSLGFLFGIARGGLLICLIFIAIEWMIPNVGQPTWFKNARSMPLIKTCSEFMYTLLPINVADATKLNTNQNDKLQNQKLFKDLIAPSLRGSDSEALEGYGKKIRNEMERLIESNSQ